MSVSSRLWAGAILGISAHASGLAASLSTPRISGDFLVEKVSAVPPMTVRAMVQTRDGYLWFGSYDGLYRFDGVRLVAFHIGDCPSLTSDSIRVLYEDRSANLWIGTDDAGLMRYVEGEFFRVGPAQGLTETEVRCIGEDRDGTLWVGTRRGAFSLKSGRFVAWQAADVLARAQVNALATAPGGALWFATSAGLFRLDDAVSKPAAVLTNHEVQSFAIDASNVVWVAADSRSNYRISSEGSRADLERRPIQFAWFQTGLNGDLWAAGTKGTLFHSRGGGGLTNAAAVAAFERPHLTSICEGADGNIWVGVESHGLYRLRPKRVRTLTSSDGIPTENVATILEDSAGRIWLGTFGRGLFVANGGGLPFEPRPVPTVANVTALHQARDGTLWLGTYNGDRFRWNGSAFVPNTDGAAGCRVIYEDRGHALWIGTVRDGAERHEGGRMQRFRTTDGLSSDHITCLTQDASGDIWIGAQRGLNRLSAGKVTRFAGEEALRNRTILGLYVDRSGDLWIAGAGVGLMRYRDGRLQRVGSGNGLPSDSIDDLLEDDEGRIWLATAEGIACVPRDELDACAEGRKSFVNCVVLGAEDGMVLARCGSGFKPSCLKSRSGRLWFCTAGGVVVVDPTTIRPRARPPPVYIEEVLADDRPVPTRRRGEHGLPAVFVPPGTSRVGFRYTALGFSAPERLQFRYRLDGYDHEWIGARGSRVAYYTHLPAGAYRFNVLASGKGGVSNEAGATLAVTVVPAWWQTWWFRGLAGCGLAGLIFGLYEWRVQQHRMARSAQEAFSRRLIESQEQERKRVAAELHDSLGQSLQIIKGRAQLALSRTDQPDQRNRQIEEISAAAAKAIQEVRSISHALRPPELDQLGLTRALAWMAQQAGETSPTQFACELETIDKLLPPEVEISLYRIAQEGINNVLKHAQASEAILELKREDSAVRFSLFDNGRGFARAAPAGPGPGRAGQGLAGIAERVKLLGGKLDLQSAPGRGTRLTVRCKIPALPHED